MIDFRNCEGRNEEINRPQYSSSAQILSSVIVVYMVVNPHMSTRDGEDRETCSMVQSRHGATGNDPKSGTSPRSLSRIVDRILLGAVMHSRCLIRYFVTME